MANDLGPLQTIVNVSWARQDAVIMLYLKWEATRDVDGEFPPPEVPLVATLTHPPWLNSPAGNTPPTPLPVEIQDYANLGRTVLASGWVPDGLGWAFQQVWNEGIDGPFPPILENVSSDMRRAYAVWSYEPYKELEQDTVDIGAPGWNMWPDGDNFTINLMLADGFPTYTYDTEAAALADLAAWRADNPAYNSVGVFVYFNDVRKGSFTNVAWGLCTMLNPARFQRDNDGNLIFTIEVTNMAADSYDFVEWTLEALLYKTNNLPVDEFNEPTNIAGIVAADSVHQQWTLDDPYTDTTVVTVTVNTATDFMLVEADPADD